PLAHCTALHVGYSPHNKFDSLVKQPAQTTLRCPVQTGAGPPLFLSGPREGGRAPKALWVVNESAVQNRGLHPRLTRGPAFCIRIRAACRRSTAMLRSGVVLPGAHPDGIRPSPSSVFSGHPRSEEPPGSNDDQTSRRLRSPPFFSPGTAPRSIFERLRKTPLRRAG